MLSLNEAAALYLKESEAFDVTKQYLCKPQRQALQRLCELLFGEGLRKPETSDEYRNGEGKLRVSDATTQTELLRECAQTQTEATLGPTSHSADAGAHPTGASSCGGCPTWAMGSCTSEIDDPVAHKQWLQEQIERERESRNPMLSAYLQWTETPVALGELADALRGRLQGRTGAELMEPFVAYVIENAAGAFLGAQVARRSAPKPLGLRVTDWDRQRDVGFLFHPLPDKGVDLFVVTEALGAAPGLQLHALQVKHGKTELTYTDRTGSAPFAVQSIRERLEAGAQAIQEALEAQGHALEQVFYYVWSTGGFIQRSAVPDSP